VPSQVALYTTFTPEALGWAEEALSVAETRGIAEAAVRAVGLLAHWRIALGIDATPWC
jgi:hypothetical protein